MPRFRFLSLVLCALFLSAPGSAIAYGPGVHVVESTRALELLIEEEPAWAGIAETPYGMSYMFLGSVSPDLQWFLETVDFGHSLPLSYHLLDAAEEMGPAYRMFAFGHMSHNAVDPSSELFVTPALISSARLGATDMFEGYDDGEAESEGLVEVYGDLILGNWDGFIDATFDLWMEDEAAQVRGEEIVRWYCTEAKAFGGYSVDCDEVWDEMGDLFAMLDEYLGNYDRQGAKNFFHFLFDRPLPQLVDLFSSGALSALAGDALAVSENIDDELARLRDGALADPSFWDQYAEGLADIGPRWTVARYFTRATGWPAHNYQAMTCGNIESLMQFFPEDYDVVPGFVVDQLRWTDAGGTAVAGIDPDGGPQDLVAHVRFYSAYPLTATVRGVVRAHRPLATEGDGAALGEAEVAVDIDPHTYVETPRSTLAIPFTVDPSEGESNTLLGAFLDLTIGDRDQPTLTTRWDRLWELRDAPIDLPVYQNNYGNYGHFLSSLPVTGAVDPRRYLIVVVRDAGDELRLPGATVRSGEASELTGVSGLVRLLLDEGEHSVVVERDGYEEAEPLLVTLDEGETRIVQVFLTELPAPPVDVVEAVDVGTPDVWVEPDIPAEPDVTAEPDLGAEPDAGAAPELAGPDTASVEITPDVGGTVDIGTDEPCGGGLGCNAGARPAPGTAALLVLGFLFALALRRRARVLR